MNHVHCVIMGNINKLWGKFHFISALKVVVRACAAQLRSSCPHLAALPRLVNPLPGKRDHYPLTFYRLFVLQIYCVKTNSASSAQKEKKVVHARSAGDLLGGLRCLHRARDTWQGIPEPPKSSSGSELLHFWALGFFLLPASPSRSLNLRVLLIPPSAKPTKGIKWGVL